MAGKVMMSLSTKMRHGKLIFRLPKCISSRDISYSESSQPFLKNDQLTLKNFTRMSSAMVFPELYAKNSHSSVLSTVYLLNKYKHLIKWPKNASLLEYGFGDGETFRHSVLPLLPSDYHEYVATDISKAMVDYARKTVKLPRFQFVEMDAGTEDLPDNFVYRFDLIFSFFASHFVKNQPHLFKNLHQMLKPGGQIFLITFERSQLDIVHYHMGQHPKWGQYSHKNILSYYYHETVPKASMKLDLEAAGFKSINFRLDELSYEFKDDDEWQDFFTSCNPVIPEIPQEELEEYKECFFDHIRKYVLVDDEDLRNTKSSKMIFSMFVVCATNNNI